MSSRGGLRIVRRSVGSRHRQGVPDDQCPAFEPKEHLQAIRDADASGWEIVGTFHSHPHTVGFPSVTDVTLAPDPSWLYVLVGMEEYDSPTVRAFRIRDGEITEEELEFEENDQ